MADRPNMKAELFVNIKNNHDEENMFITDFGVEHFYELLCSGNYHRRATKGI